VESLSGFLRVTTIFGLTTTCISSVALSFIQNRLFASLPASVSSCTMAMGWGIWTGTIS
jgi:hypothetical protein